MKVAQCGEAFSLFPWLDGYGLDMFPASGLLGNARCVIVELAPEHVGSNNFVCLATSSNKPVQHRFSQRHLNHQLRAHVAGPDIPNGINDK
jgi:hypothetical protein